MKIFVTGGSGYVGSAVVKELIAADHQVIGLARSERSAEKLRAFGAVPRIAGMTETDKWQDAAADADGIIHMAATFDENMAEAESTFLSGIEAVTRTHPDKRFLYTGGVWLYGTCADTPAAEGSGFKPLDEFAFMVAHRDRLFANPDLRASVVHPGLVWDEDGGMINPLLEDAKKGRALRLPATENLRWPLVHRDDLARLYRLAIEKDDNQSDYHAIAEAAVPMSEIASTISRQAGISTDPVVDRTHWSDGAHLSQHIHSEQTREALGWQPNHPGILETQFQLA
ncbi:NAD-dependent epimerase/dehydratase family protein [Aestuariispira insulae]|uniref:Nucleoside-diphosphate-sugar epimerase n=1 Tax=Aestuariispira insulae TaxID=1461337 RepID=A0A3D9H8M4_9PROT|nr:NAD-dependent epimerase/dehydratase family protein [Aestuariispira insulae]RED45850.1 nucleoside-diphosphate-sugar epimerase [Aestuariispira insulae]